MKLKHKLIGGRWVMRSLFRKGRVWYGRVRDSRSGRVREISTRERERHRAEQRLIEWIEELERREMQTSAAYEVRFDQAYREYLDLKDVRPATLVGYRTRFEGIYAPAFGTQLVHEVEMADIERFLKRTKSERGVAPRTRREYLTQLRSFFRWARLRGYCQRDPTEGVKVPRGPKRKGVALNVEQARTLLRACQERVVVSVRYSNRRASTQTSTPPRHLFLSVLLAIHTGLRRGNVIRLRWEQVDLRARRISIPAEEMKSNADHEIPLHPELAEILAEELRTLGRPLPDAPVIGSEVGEIKKSFQSALRRAGLPPIRFHDLRHTASTWWGERCTHAVHQRLMGHAPADMTAHYTHIPFETLRRVVDGMPRLLEPGAVAAEERPMVLQ